MSQPSPEARTPARDEAVRDALELHSLSKSFGGVHALSDLTWTLPAATVSAIVGDNGAGKSTLLNLLSGALQPDGGEIRLWGERVELRSPDVARRLGLETVYQDLALIPTLSVYANMFMGREKTKGGRIGRWLGWLDRKAMAREAGRLLGELHIGVDSVRQSVAQLSGGQQQGVAVGRSLQSGGRILLLDEPTAALGTIESREVFNLVKRLKAIGYTILLISHNLDEVEGLADRVAVLRRGKLIGECEGLEVTRKRMVEILHA